MAIELAGDPSEEQCVDFSLALLKRKGEEWVYEREWRALSQIRHLEQVSVGGKVLYFTPPRPELVKEVILGWRFPSENVAGVKQICSRNFPTARLLRAVPHDTEFKMAINELEAEDLNASPTAWAIPPQDFGLSGVDSSVSPGSTPDS